MKLQTTSLRAPSVYQRIAMYGKMCNSNRADFVVKCHASLNAYRMISWLALAIFVIINVNTKTSCNNLVRCTSSVAVIVLNCINCFFFSVFTSKSSNQRVFFHSRYVILVLIETPSFNDNTIANFVSNMWKPLNVLHDSALMTSQLIFHKCGQTSWLDWYGVWPHFNL